MGEFNYPIVSLAAWAGYVFFLFAHANYAALTKRDERLPLRGPTLASRFIAVMAGIAFVVFDAYHASAWAAVLLPVVAFPAGIAAWLVGSRFGLERLSKLAFAGWPLSLMAAHFAL